MRYVAIILATLVLLTFTTPVSAQENPTCGTLENVMEHLKKTYGEEAIFRGISQKGQVMIIVFANLETGTWSAAATRPDKRTCLIDAGDGFALRELNQGEPS